MLYFSVNARFDVTLLASKRHGIGHSSVNAATGASTASYAEVAGSVRFCRSPRDFYASSARRPVMSEPRCTHSAMHNSMAIVTSCDRPS
ncbi:hypothetical protein ASF76_02740 [Microbacterium sp. Leaf151]|nr:hypothetical protein ASF76_02740 [Microbacterium sp. Leaf151]